MGLAVSSLYGACCVKLYVIIAFPGWMRDDLRGARDRAPSSRRNLVFGRSARDLDHDARMRIGSEAPWRRTHSHPRLKGHCWGRDTATSDRPRQPALMGERAPKRNLLVDARRGSGHRAQGDALRGLAGGHQTPQRDQELSREGDDHGFARAAAGVRRARPVPLRQRALLLEQEKAPRELEHAAAHTSVAHLGQAPIPPFGAALVWRAGQASVARHGPPVAQVARQDLVHEHVRGLDANADHPGQQTDHGLGPRGRSLLEPFDPGLLDLFDLIPHKAQARQIAAQLSQRVGRQGGPLRRTHRLQALRRGAEGRVEAPDAETDQRAFDPVHEPGALADQGLPLAARALGILLVQGRDGRHAAVAWLTTQPAEKRALEQRGVEPVSLGTPVFARDGDAGWMNDIGLNAARPQPARQPEAVATGLISDGDARDRASRLGGFVLPAAEQAKQDGLVGVDLLERVASDPGHDRGHEPARLAHLNDGYEGAALIEGETGSAQVIVLRHEKLQGWFDQRGCFTLAGLHSFSPPPWPKIYGGGAARWAAAGCPWSGPPLVRA